MRKLLLMTWVTLVSTSFTSCAGKQGAEVSIEKTSCLSSRSFTTIKGTPGITMSTSNCEDYRFKEEKIRKAIMLFVEDYSEEFNIPELEVWSLISNLSIEVSVLPRTVDGVFDVKGNFLKKDVLVSGLALNPNLIWVEVKTSQIWSSSLAHELVHIIIWRTQGVHGDPDHEGKQFSGWTSKHTDFLKRFKLRLIDLEI